MPNLVETIKKAAVEAVNASNPTSLVLGVVTSTSPLEITVEQRLSLTEDFLILTKHVVDHYVDMTVSHNTENANVPPHSHTYSGTTDSANIDQHTHTTSTETTGTATSTEHEHTYSGTTSASSGDTHSHTYSGKKKILLHYGLKQGESVLLIKMQGGQKYIVLDRIGDVPVEGEWVE